MALSKFTSHSLRNVLVGKGLTSVQHSLCFTQRVYNSQVVTQHIRKVTPLIASNSHVFARTFARYADFIIQAISLLLYIF